MTILKPYHLKNFITLAGSKENKNLVDFGVVKIFNTKQFFSIGKYPHQKGNSEIEIRRPERILLTQVLNDQLCLNCFIFVQLKFCLKSVLCFEIHVEKKDFIE